MNILAVPSQDLVARVKNLYHKRVSDVRFLIPVLNGLTKSEIITALPKLIKLNPNVVKEVRMLFFNIQYSVYLNTSSFLLSFTIIYHMDNY